ncbi:MAG: FAD binding domain-containing protein, partial [Nitrososphaerales archaeon]
MLYELPEFEYFEPETLDEALDILKEFGTRAKILAGGTDLLGLMKDRITGPEMPIPAALVNIKRIRELRFLLHADKESILGSALTLSEIHSDSETARRFPGLVQAAKSVATNQIRNMGTLGGNLC